MKILRNYEKGTICLVDEHDNKLLETDRVGTDFVVLIHTETPIEITEKNCKEFYGELIKLMENNYLFHDSNISQKD